MRQTGDHHLLERMDRTEFLRTVERARVARADAEKLLSWAARLLPLLEAHPEWTIAQAIDRYHADAARHPV
jgi:hypothetical protein